MKYIKVTCHVKYEEVEFVSDYLFSLNCLGTEIIESDFKNKQLEDKFGEIYTLNKADYPDMGVIIIGYFEDHNNLKEIKRNISHFFIENKIEIINGLFSIEEIADFDYTNSWKDYYREININEHVVIIPSWYQEFKGKINLKIEPGLGFGTGSHPTTFMCLNHLANFVKANDSVCDLGTGSGIIAILAKLLGASTVYGIDLDLAALKNAQYNAKINHIDTIKWTDNSLNQIGFKFDIIVANIVYDVIIQLLPEIKNNLIEDGLLIISGVTKLQKDDIIKRLVKKDFILIKLDEMQDFVSFVFRK